MRANLRPVPATPRLLMLGGAVTLLAACAQPTVDAAPDPDQLAVRRWLLCEECVHGELDSIRDPSRRDRAVPLLARALAGPPASRRANMRRQLEETYQRLAARAVDQGETLPLTMEQYVAHFLGNYEAVYQTRAIRGLAAVGTPEALRVLSEAKARVESGEAVYRGDVAEALGHATGGAAVGGSLTRWTSVAAGSRHTCGRRTDGRTFCWGQNDHGQLGIDDPAGSMTPKAVQASVNLTSVVAAGNHSCGLVKGEVFCWGSNSRGELGDSTTTDRATPTPTHGGLIFAGVAVGGAHTCAWTTSGEVYCWGFNNGGQLGDGTTDSRSWPRLSIDSIQFRSVAAGTFHTCGVASSTGVPYCWGMNEDRQLGFGGLTGVPVPVQMRPEGLRVGLLSLGRLHTCALTSDAAASHEGNAYCVGRNDDGELGNGEAGTQDSLMLVVGSHRFVTISLGGRHTCGITGNGSMYCWGINSAGQLGDGTTGSRDKPVPVQGGLRFSAVSAGEAHTCGVTVDGAAYCWGLNVSGQLGDGTDNNRLVPTEVTTP